MTQPKDLLTWATTAAYTAPGEAWDLQPRREKPSNAEMADGFKPRDEARAQLLNWLLGNASEHLAAIVDAAALTYSPYLDSRDNGVDTEGVFGFEPRIMTAYANGRPVLVCRTKSLVLTRRLAYSPDKGRNWSFPTPVIGGSGDQDLIAVSCEKHTASAPTTIAYENSTGTAYKSTDLTTWSPAGSLPSVSNWKCATCTPAPAGVAYHIICGTGKIARSTGSGAWTSSVVPGAWSGVIPYRAVTADPLSVSHEGDVLVLPEGPPHSGSAPSSTVLVSTDAGATWATRTTQDGTARVWVDACWSRSHQVWLLLSQDGRLYSSPDLGSTFTLRANLGGTCQSMACLGRSVAVARKSTTALTGSGSAKRGSLVVSSDLTRWRFLQVWNDATDNCFQIVEHEGELALVQSQLVSGSQYAVRLHWSLRLPSEISTLEVSLTP